MEGLLSIDPGLMIWTLINFGIFFALFMYLFLKPIKKFLKDREERIRISIESAETTRLEAEKMLTENRARHEAAQAEITEFINRGREQAQKIISEATNEAENIRHKKIEEASREIERKKQEAIGELRNEVANLVVIATEKLLNEKIDKNKHVELIKNSIQNLPSN